MLRKAATRAQAPTVSTHVTPPKPEAQSILSSAAHSLDNSLDLSTRLKQSGGEALSLPLCLSVEKKAPVQTQGDSLRWFTLSSLERREAERGSLFSLPRKASRDQNLCLQRT